MPSFITKELPKLLNVKASNLDRSFKNGNIKFYDSQGLKAIQSGNELKILKQEQWFVLEIKLRL